MNQVKFLQPLDTMERISRAELGSNLDELLEKIDKEDVGMVITDEGKDDLVICPAHWFMCTFDDDLGCIMNSALRYSLGRQTYMPSTVMSFVRRYIHLLDTRTISVMIEDIERELHVEDLYERAGWIQLRDELKVQLDNLRKQDDALQQALKQP